VAAGTPALGQIASTAVSGHIARVLCNELVGCQGQHTRRDDVHADVSPPPTRRVKKEQERKRERGSLAIKRRD